MEQKNRKTLKSYFEKGDVPTEEQFAELIDSVPNIVDDGQVIRTKIAGLSIHRRTGSSTSTFIRL